VAPNARSVCHPLVRPLVRGYHTGTVAVVVIHALKPAGNHVIGTDVDAEYVGSHGQRFV
jgi:hypothetical protein